MLGRSARTIVHCVSIAHVDALAPVSAVARGDTAGARLNFPREPFTLIRTNELAEH